MLANSRGPPDRFQPYLFANRFGGRKMNKDPEKVFIRSKDGYEEITFEEFLNREASNEEYKKKKFVYCFESQTHSQYWYSNFLM